MIYGIGTDITEVKRFEKWVNNPSILNRYFNKEEQKEYKNSQSACEHYASRFAVKEAFGKALGIGITGFLLKDVFVKNNEYGKPELVVTETAEKKLHEMCGLCKVHVSLSHEKDYAIAYVIIEI